MINQETAELHKRFAAYRAILAQMSNQGGEMLPLPKGVKLEKLKSFTGMIDIDIVNAFVFQVEKCFSLINIVDAN